MNRDQIEGQCRQLVGRFAELFGEYTANPRCAALGRKIRLSGWIQQHCGIISARSQRELHDFVVRYRGWNAQPQRKWRVSDRVAQFCERVFMMADGFSRVRPMADAPPLRSTRGTFEVHPRSIAAIHRSSRFENPTPAPRSRARV